MQSKNSFVSSQLKCLNSLVNYHYTFCTNFILKVSKIFEQLLSAQLETLKNINFGHVMCATSNFQYLPRDVFRPMKDQ